MIRDPAVLAARARVVASKAQLDLAVAHAKVKLSPRALASDAVDSATDKATIVAQNGMQIVRDRPVAAAAIVGAIAVALARKPLFGLAGAMFGRGYATGDDDASLISAVGDTVPEDEVRI